MPLTVSPPDQPYCARLRFTATAGDPASDLIREYTHAPFSHVEAVLKDSIVGSYYDKGVAQLPLDHDQSSNIQVFADLQMDEGTYTTWLHFFQTRLGDPYDYDATLGLATLSDKHKSHAYICSSLQLAALRYCHWFPRPSPLRFHVVTPGHLLLALWADARVKFSGVEEVATIRGGNFN